MLANILPADRLPTQSWRVGSKGQNSTFTKHCHFAYQINGYYKCSNMVAIILPADPPPQQPFGQNVKIQLLKNIVMLHIKLSEVTNTATW